MANCQIKEALFCYASGSEDTPFEIWTSRRSQVENSSEKSFDLTIVEKKKCNLVALEDLVNVECILVHVKVVDMEDIQTVKNKHEKGIYNVKCDGSRWDYEIGKLELSKSYQLEDVAVRVSNDIKHLSFSEGTTIMPVEDIVEIAYLPLAKDVQLYQEKRRDHRCNVC